MLPPLTEVGGGCALQAEVVPTIHGEDIVGAGCALGAILGFVSSHRSRSAVKV